MRASNQGLNVGQEPYGNLAGTNRKANLRRRYRIALIEGDALMRELARRWLGTAGHDVVLVSARQPGSPATSVDLVMADVANLRGAVDRVQSLRAAYGAPVLLVSGRLRRSSAPSRVLALQLGAAAVLPKPYSREQLFAAIEAALAAAA